MTDLHVYVVAAYSTGSPVDHTWVTTYDNRTTRYPDISAVVAAREHYWFCWGAFHANGVAPEAPDGHLATFSGDVALATCLVSPDVDSRTVLAGQGTIFTYGVDGVCHQLANQILYACRHSDAGPATVKGARGYVASSFIYGTYGLQHAAWQSRLAHCAPLGVEMAERIEGGAPDDFLDRAQALLQSGHPDVLAALLALRGEAKASALALRAETPLSTEALNLRNQEILDQAAAMLGADRFTILFGFPPEHGIDLVDTAISDPLKK